MSKIANKKKQPDKGRKITRQRFSIHLGKGGFMPDKRTSDTGYLELDPSDFFNSPLDFLIMSDDDEAKNAEKIACMIVEKLVSRYAPRLKYCPGSRLIKRYNIRPIIIKILKELGYTLDQRREMTEEIHKLVNEGDFFIVKGKAICKSGHVK